MKNIYKLNFFILIILLLNQAYSAEKNLSLYPILDAIETSGGGLSDNTKKWMKKWYQINLEDLTKFQFKELSGTTSITLKIQKIDLNDSKGYKSYGSFLSFNDSGNPNSEIAYFSLAAILGFDKMFRPAIRYELGPLASNVFKNLLHSSIIKGKQRLENKKRIIDSIEASKPLLGCLKAKKSDSNISFDDLAKRNGSFKSSHLIAKFIQASKAQPIKGHIITLMKNYSGDALDLAREFSILLTLDSIFGQYDRFSGGNVTLLKDDLKMAHFVASDNGGAEILDSVYQVKKTVKLFSRYDRKGIYKIREFYKFLQSPSEAFLGYTNPEEMIVDMGMYFLKSPQAYLSALKNNIGILLNEVQKNEKRYGENVFFSE